MRSPNGEGREEREMAVALVVKRELAGEGIVVVVVVVVEEKESLRE